MEKSVKALIQVVKGHRGWFRKVSQVSLEEQLQAIRILDIIANNQIDQKVVELSSSQQYFLVENSLYRSVFSSSRGRG